MEASYAERVRGLDDLDLCCSVLDHVRGRAPQPEEREVLRAALEHGRLAEALPTLPAGPRPATVGQAVA
jgi:exonuclease SbcD